MAKSTYARTRACAAIIVTAVLVANCPAYAALEAVLAEDGTNQFVLRNVRDNFRQIDELVIHGDRLPVIHSRAKCETLGSKLIEQARSTEYSFKTLLARYNLVNLWMGTLCDGSSDVIPTADEAQSWLSDLAVLKDTKDGRPFEDTHQMLTQLYLFGAPGVVPDYSVAMTYLNEEAKAGARYVGLYLGYMYEQGLGVAVDKRKAHGWMEQAVGINSVDRKEYGGLYARILHAQAVELGTYEKRDRVHAFHDYLDLSKYNYPPVWFHLGLMYLEGRGTPKDACQAKYWLQQVAQRNSSPAPQAVAYLEKISRSKLCLEPMLVERYMLSAKPGVGNGGITLSEKSAVTSVVEKRMAQRSREEVEGVFERSKGGIYAIYSRALRNNPELKGKVVLEVTIAGSGEVTKCTVVSSEIDDELLKTRLTRLVSAFRFEARDVEALTLTKPIDFFPVK